MLLGFGLGALVGTAIGYLLTEDNRKKVSKGVFITTSEFTKEARKEVQEQVGKLVIKNIT